MAKLVTRLEALGSASMRFTCFSIAPGLRQSARRGERQQFLIRAGVPQEERKPRSQFQIGESELGVWRLRPSARESPRYRNSGLARTAATTCSIP